MDNEDKEKQSAIYRQIEELSGKLQLLRATIENTILENTEKYKQYDYNLRHQIMRNDIIKELSKSSEYQTLNRQIIQLKAENNRYYNDMPF